MRGTNILKLPSRNLDFIGEPVSHSPQNLAQRLLPFYLIEGAVICCDAVLILSTSLLTGVIYHLALSSFNGVGPITAFLGVGTLTYVNFSAILAARADYRPEALTNFWKQARETTAIWLFVFFVLLAVAFSFKVSEEYSRGAIWAFFAVGWAAIIGWRFAVARLIVHALSVGAFAKQRTILLADERQLSGSSAVDELKRCGYTPARIFEFAQSSVSSRHPSSELLKTIDEIVQIARQESIACVFLLAPWDGRRSIEQLTELLRPLPIPVYLLPDHNVAHFFGSRIVSIGTAWTAELQRAPLNALERACKRTLDLLIAAVSLIVLAPLMTLIAALIKIDGRGPVFFIQTRNGFNGQPFGMYKFRTMSVMEDGSAIRQAAKNDSRFTRVGPLLRRLSIDELPQLFNVVKGDMSLVGPRPHALAHNTKYQDIIANYAFRHHVKPGLTGWAQINGFRGATQTVDLMARRVEFDLWYINNWSFWLDLKILLRTLILGLQPTAY